MNDSFDEQTYGGTGGSYMSLGHQEKSELIFKDIKNSYIFWQIKKSIKDEIVKSKGKPQDISDMIPKLLSDLNLETKIKNKVQFIHLFKMTIQSPFLAISVKEYAKSNKHIQVHEILDKNGYFRDSAQVAITKFKNCKDINMLPQYFFDKDYEPLESVATAKRAWSETLKQKLNSILRQSRKPFVRPKKEKPPPVKVKVEEAQNNSADGDSDTQNIKCLYYQNTTTPSIPTTSATQQQKEVKESAFLGQDLPFIFDSNMMLDAILKINTINFSGNLMLSWGQIKLQLQTRSLDELRKKYNELNVTLKFIILQSVDEEKSFVDERILIGERLLSKDYQPFLVQYAKRGVPPTLRNRIYRKILYADVTQKEVDYYSFIIPRLLISVLKFSQFSYNLYYNQLCEQANKWETALDDLIYADILEFCNDDKYFIFQDMIEACVVMFFRDRQVLENIKSKPHAPIVGIAGTDRIVGAYPPCGVLPCLKFSSYFGPLSYLSDKKEECYYIFRALYCKYYCYLNTISSHNQSIISLCKLFEDLLQMFEPEVCYHLNQLGIQPLKIAFPWIFYAFVGYLEVDQIYLVWDRILGFESLEILPILSAAIFVFRANLILNCNNQDEFEELFADLSQIKVMPLIQHFLFATGIN